MNEVRGITIFIEVETESSGTSTVTGQLISEDRDWLGALVELQGGDFPQRLAVTDEIGEFAFEGIQAKQVLLKVTGQHGVSIILPQIDFRD